MSRYTFITYAHDNLAHERKVLELANKLRVNGVDAQIDQYEPHPPQGWPKWMEDQFLKADAILVIPSEKYLERYSQMAGVGSGARFESAILTSVLLKNGVSFEKVAIVLLNTGDASFIPDLLHGCTRYDVSRPDQYDPLYRWLTDQRGIVRPQLGAIQKLPSLDLSDSKTFSLLCRDLKPLIDDNGRIFRDFGPNSGADSTGPVRFDLTAWHELRCSKIVPNNARIRDLIKAHYNTLPAEQRQLFDSLLSHIDAFEAHVANPNIDYRDHQFPKVIVDIINTNSL
jgi:hypothetical protein